MIVVPFSPEARIVNAECLPRASGARYLECIRGNCGLLVAVAWRRKIPTKPEPNRAFVEYRR